MVNKGREGLRQCKSTAFGSTGINQLKWGNERDERINGHSTPTKGKGHAGVEVSHMSQNLDLRGR